MEISTEAAHLFALYASMINFEWRLLEAIKLPQDEQAMKPYQRAVYDVIAKREMAIFDRIDQIAQPILKDEIEIDETSESQTALRDIIVTLL